MEKKTNKKLKQRGITLIALVITIIVLLILAGVSIAMLTGDNGILTQANEAKEQTRISGLEEELKIKFESNNMLISLEINDKNEDLKDVEILGSSEDDKGNFYTAVFKNERFKVYYNPNTNYVYDVVYFKLKELNIYTYEDLIEFAKRVNNGENFEDYIVYLQNDISLRNEEWIVIGKAGTREESEKYFNGIFEGKGNTIEGLLISNDSQTQKGLFAGNKGTIQKLNVKVKVEYQTSWYVSNGGIVGTNLGNISNCNVEIDGVLKSDAMNYESELGGIAGTNAGTIKDCKSSGKIEVGGKYVTVGGISGRNYAKIEKCINEAEIVINEQGYVSQSQEGIAGGIVGENDAEIFQSINKGKIRGYNYILGGIVGKNFSEQATIDECTNWGDFETSFTQNNNLAYAPIIGGICAENNSGTIKNSYNIGNGIKHENEGWNASTWDSMAGITAQNRNKSKIINCYTIGRIPQALLADSNAAIYRFSNDSSEYSNNYYNTETCISNDLVATGLSTEEIKKEDFISKLGESFKKDTEGINNGYPILKWQ